MDSERKSLSPFWSGPNPAAATPRSGGAGEGSALPSLKKDNFHRKQNLKSRFVAEENIRLYIQKFGANNIGFLTVTASDCISAKDFQMMWHPFMKTLQKLFPHGMWVRERQPRSGNWHCHAVVSLGRDFKSGFPFEQVEKRFYANVAPWIRMIWKSLRDLAEKYGLGRIELLPLKHGGKACAGYLTKYLAKATNTEKCEGEEKCRLFGTWGKVRFVSSKFSWVSSRIIEKRKEWLATDSGLADKSQVKQLYGPHWWHHYGRLLMDVIMPVEYYQVLKDGELVWDDLGQTAYEIDLQKFRGISSEEDRVLQSRFQLYYSHGMCLFNGDARRSNEYALNRVGYHRNLDATLEMQLYLDLESI